MPNGIPLRLPARMKDGTTVEIRYEDLGDTCPGFDRQGRPWAVYTSWFRLGGPGSLQDYVQVDREEAIQSGNVPEFRRKQEVKILEMAGVDTSTIEWP